MKRSLLSLLWIVFLLPDALFAEETVTIGGVDFKIPVPAGFARFDGVNQNFDKIMGQTVSPTNRVLMTLATNAAVEAAKAGKVQDLGRYFSVQTLRRVENLTASPANFAQLVQGAERSLVGGQVSAEVKSSMNERMKKIQDSNGLKLREPAMLGIYQKSERFIDSGMLMKVQQTTGAPKTIAGAFSTVLIRGKLVSLFVYASFNGPEDVTWTQKTLQEWREAVVAANPE